MIGGSSGSIGLLVLECIRPFGPRVSGVVGSLGKGLVSRGEDWVGGSNTLLEGILSKEGLVGKRFASSGLLNGIIATSAILTVREMWFCANCAFEVGTDPVFRLDLFHRLSGLNAIIAGLVVFSLEMFPASTESAYWGTRFFACKTSFHSSVLVLHTRFVLAGELPAKVALLEVDSFLPMVRCNKGREHDDLGPDNFLGDGIVRVHDGEAQVPGVGFVWDFSRGPIRVECEFGILEEWVRVLDFLEESLFRPGGIFSHSVSIYFRFSDHSARNLSIDDFVPDGGFGEGDGWVARS